MLKLNCFFLSCKRFLCMYFTIFAIQDCLTQEKEILKIRKLQAKNQYPHNHYWLRSKSENKMAYFKKLLLLFCFFNQAMARTNSALVTITAPQEGKKLSIYTPTWDTSLSLKKNVQLNRCCFRYLWEKQNYPVKKKLINFRTCKNIEVKRSHLVKKWEFVHTKKNLLYQFFKTRICAFMTYGQFPPKSRSNLRFAVQDSRVWSLCWGKVEDLKPSDKQTKLH